LNPKNVVAAAMVLAAVVAGYLYWASDERRIARLLDEVADAVSQSEGESGVAALAEITSVTPHLAQDVEIDVSPPPAAALRGAQEVVSMVGRLRALFPVVQLTLREPSITVDANRTAQVTTTATLTMRDREGAETVESRQVAISLEERDGRWVIVYVSTSST
jgi:hypothetical protein